MRYYVNTIYPAFQGECNIRGIGAPVIFVRLQGCHLRCYKDTLGSLCDTPEALEGKEGGTWMEIEEILLKVMEISLETGGTDLICLSGGDPLWRKPSDVEALLRTLSGLGFHTSVETSGTLSMKNYRSIPDVSWVLDFKLLSAGVKQNFCYEDLPVLNEKDFIKFVVFDDADYEQFKEVLPTIRTRAKICIGVYWGGKMGTMILANRLMKDGLLGSVHINVQLHKMATFSDLNHDLISATIIPNEI